MNRLEGKTVLVADDDEDVLVLLRDVFTREGFRVLCATNGKEAVKIAKENRVDAAVIDLMMPEINGIETLRSIKAVDETIEVFIMTGYPDMETLDQIFRSGGSDYITKPFDPREITRGVQHALHRRAFSLQVRPGARVLKAQLDQMKQDFEKTTRQLRESQLKYQQIVEHSNDAIVLIQDEKIKFLNDQVLKLSGYKKEELLDQSFVKLIHPDEAPIMKARHWSRLRGEEPPMTYEFRVVRKSGEVIWLEKSTAKTVWEGRPATLNVVRDITDRKRTEEALRESEERYRSLVENTQDGFFIADVASGRFLFQNKRLGKLLGYPPKKAKRLSIWDVFATEEHEKLRKIIEESSKQRKRNPKPELYRVLLKDGSIIEVELSLSFASFQGRAAIQGMLRDVTDRETLQRQLIHAQKMEAVGTLAGGVAHEFNNILAGIQGYTQLTLFNVGLHHPTAKYLNTIFQSCNRAADLVRKLLTFSRGDTWEKVPSNVNQVVESVKLILSQTLSPQIELETNLDEDLPLVMAEPTMLEHVLLNLGVNARDAMPEGGMLRIITAMTELDREFCRAHSWAKKGWYIEIRVEDTGHGMPQEVLDRVFEPFFTTKEPGKGTGLGLSLAYSIVKRHGGYILAESEEDKGSRFRIFLPVALMSADKERRLKEKLELPRGKGEHVLVVDDEPDCLEVTREILMPNGYKVALAGNGKEALSLYKEAMESGNAFDLVVLDLSMPVMDGHACLDQILAMDPRAKVIIATGHGDDQLDSRELSRKAEAILFKPFDLKLLLHKVQEALAS